MKPLFHQFGAYQLISEFLQVFFTESEESLQPLKNELDQEWVLCLLSAAYAKSGQPHHATKLMKLALSIASRLGEKENIAFYLAEVAPQLMAVGKLKSTEVVMMRSLDLFTELHNELKEMRMWERLAELYSYRGEWDELSQS